MYRYAGTKNHRFSSIFRFTIAVTNNSRRFAGSNEAGGVGNTPSDDGRGVESRG